MSDFQRLSNAVSIINKGNIDKAWAALNWMFCSTDLEPDGFYQTMCHLGVNAERYKNDMLHRSKIARAFLYGPGHVEDDKDDQKEAG